MAYENNTRLFEAQRAYRQFVKASTAEQRRKKLSDLKKTLRAHEPAIYAALKQDMHKPPFEVAVSELLPIYNELDAAIANVACWMREVSLSSREKIVYEPRGTCLIIGPWNYPLSLMMIPLVSAIAAGNCCILKPSELAQATSAVLEKIIHEVFDEKEVAVVLGGAEVASGLLTLPFDHIFFTGSTKIGKLVGQAAAKNLASVTLELGGKTPTIIDETADLKAAARIIAWGKFLNAGQTCIAPDYLFMPRSHRDEFVDTIKKVIHDMYILPDGQFNDADYAHIIDDRHVDRLNHLLSDAQQKGAHVVVGGTSNKDRRIVYPTVLTDVTSSMDIMHEEIFGPLLPILTYDHIDEAITYIDAHAKPLSFYIFSNDTKNIDMFLRRTTSGNVCVNDVMMQYASARLPFGGINASGIGSYHGVYGFKAFSHERAVYYHSRFDMTNLRLPPYVHTVDMALGRASWIQKLKLFLRKGSL